MFRRGDAGFVEGVHDAGVVGADEVGGEDAASGAVDGVAEHLAVAEDDVFGAHPLAREVLVLGMDMEGVGLGLGGTELAVEVFAIDTEAQLVVHLGVVAQAVVDVVVGDAGACAEWYLTAEVGEEVEGVVVVVLGDGEVAMEHHPVDEVGELTESASDALRGLSLGDGESFFITSGGGSAPYLVPHGEGLARVDDESVDMGDGEGEVGSFVLLELHVDIPQSAADEGVVSVDDDREGVGGTFVGEGDPGAPVFEVALQDFLFRGEFIGERTEFAEQLSGHLCLQFTVYSLQLITFVGVSAFSHIICKL